MSHRRKIHSIPYLPWTILILLLLAVPATAGADYIRVKGTVVNVRQGPGTTHPVLFQAQKGEEFELVSIEGLWCRIRLTGDRDAWVFGKLVDVMEGTLPGSASAEGLTEESADAPEEWSRMAKLTFYATFILLFLVGIWKRKAILRYAGLRLKEISGYKRDQAFRYDNRKPSDDSWEL